MVIVVVSVATAFAMERRSGPRPPHRSLAAAIRHALLAKPVQGITARISFTDHVFPSGSFGPAGDSPLLSGASGRLWAGDGRLRLELQSSTGDTEVGIGPSGLVVYDVGTGTAYEFPTSGHRPPAGADHPHHGAPGMADIQRLIAHLAQRATLSGAMSTNVGGQPAYRVRISPRHDGGLLGAVELAWDADHGVPLEVAVYSQGSSSPVLALRVTQISYRRVPTSDLEVPLGSATRVVKLQPPAHATHGTDTTDRAAPLPFTVQAPPSLIGIPRLTVRRLDWAGHPVALAVYGHGLGTILVLEQAAAGGRAGPLASLPTVSVGAAVGHELETALGTILQFDRGGVSYTVIGSLPAAAAESAARAISR